ncbi:hypothetical protein RvY_12799 [Ramazzottius varieornatus]|uniref:Uncharacterized protein n=1 Tax=Ramazzottius varieornatus TaxID=947166 RepID=A0A1D1VTB6_RAMVA|nr:hypothetical protein RvY_12799 [Ramazzottius varieornatus]
MEIKISWEARSSKHEWITAITQKHLTWMLDTTYFFRKQLGADALVGGRKCLYIAQGTGHERRRKLSRR